MRAEKALIAIQEAGHAIVARAIGHGVLRVMLADGVRTRYRRGELHAHLCEAMVVLAGPLAEQHYRPTTPAEREVLWREIWGTDLDNARRHAGAYGADGKWVARQVLALVRKHWPAIMRVAWALQARGTLSTAEIDMLMQG